MSLASAGENRTGAASWDAAPWVQGQSPGLFLRIRQYLCRTPSRRLGQDRSWLPGAEPRKAYLPHGPAGAWAELDPALQQVSLCRADETDRTPDASPSTHLGLPLFYFHLFSRVRSGAFLRHCSSPWALSSRVAPAEPGTGAGTSEVLPQFLLVGC